MTELDPRQPMITGFIDTMRGQGHSVNGLDKAACICALILHAGPYKTIVDAEWATASWVDCYTTAGSTLAMVTPNKHENGYYAALNRQPQPASKRPRTWAVSV